MPRTKKQNHYVAPLFFWCVRLAIDVLVEKCKEACRQHHHKFALKCCGYIFCTGGGYGLLGILLYVEQEKQQEK